MRFKLLVKDVEGTLLDNDSKISVLNKQAIIDCIKKGSSQFHLNRMTNNYLS